MPISSRGIVGIVLVLAVLAGAAWYLSRENNEDGLLPSSILSFSAQPSPFASGATVSAVPANTPSVVPGRKILIIASEHLTCRQASDCIKITLDCRSCSCGEPVNKAYASHYYALAERACRSYDGPVCDIYCPPSTTECINQKCTVVVQPE